MPRLLDCMPFSAKPSEIAVRGERARVRADQIIVWVSLSLRRSTQQNPAIIPFPAILDTGYNHSFAIAERHLIQWAGMRPDVLGVSGTIQERGRRITLLLASLWVHVNESGRLDRVANGPPFLLRSRTGIAVYPGSDFPRLPLLGLRAIGENNLILKIDGVRRMATLRTPIRWWPFA